MSIVASFDLCIGGICLCFRAWKLYYQTKLANVDPTDAVALRWLHSRRKTVTIRTCVALVVGSCLLCALVVLAIRLIWPHDCQPDQWFRIALLIAGAVIIFRFAVLLGRFQDAFGIVTELRTVVALILTAGAPFVLFAVADGRGIAPLDAFSAAYVGPSQWLAFGYLSMLGPVLLVPILHSRRWQREEEQRRQRRHRGRGRRGSGGGDSGNSGNSGGGGGSASVTPRLWSRVRGAVATATATAAWCEGEEETGDWPECERANTRAAARITAAAAVAAAAAAARGGSSVATADSSTTNGGGGVARLRLRLRQVLRSEVCRPHLRAFAKRALCAESVLFWEELRALRWAERRRRVADERAAAEEAAAASAAAAAEAEATAGVLSSPLVTEGMQTEEELGFQQQQQQQALAAADTASVAATAPSTSTTTPNPAAATPAAATPAAATPAAAAAAVAAAPVPGSLNHALPRPGLSGDASAAGAAAAGAAAAGAAAAGAAAAGASAAGASGGGLRGRGERGGATGLRLAPVAGGVAPTVAPAVAPAAAAVSTPRALAAALGNMLSPRRATAMFGRWRAGTGGSGTGAGGSGGGGSGGGSASAVAVAQRMGGLFSPLSPRRAGAFGRVATVPGNRHTGNNNNNNNNNSCDGDGDGDGDGGDDGALVVPLLTAEQLVGLSEALHARFIDEDSLFMINISAQQRKGLADRWAAGERGSDVFAECESGVLHMVRADVFPRFQRHSCREWQAMLRALEEWRRGEEEAARRDRADSGGSSGVVAAMFQTLLGKSRRGGGGGGDNEGSGSGSSRRSAADGGGGGGGRGYISRTPTEGGAAVVEIFSAAP